MSKQQLQADISESQEEFQENLTKAEEVAIDAAWEETLNSEESASFLDSLISEGLKEMNKK